MKEKKQKAHFKETKAETGSKRSFEIDPPLKELANSIKEESGKLRKNENKETHFQKSYPSENEISFFAQSSGNLPELKEEFKESLNKIGKAFRSTFSSSKDYNEMSLEINKILIENFFQISRALAISVEARDPYTGGHSDRVFQIASELGKRCNLSSTEQLYLQGGALLHDVGKIGIRDGVLLKPGPLTESEYKEMQQHPIMGAQLVKKLNCLQGCIDVVLLHHERIDGYGYPYGLKGSEIPLVARLTSVADAYDAMTSNRIYRKALSHEEALEEILRSSGTQFDPEIVKVFVGWWEEKFQDKSSHNKSIANKENLYFHEDLLEEKGRL